MKNEVVSKKKSLTGRLLRLVVIVAVVYLAYSFISGQLQVSAKQRELDEVEARLEVQTQENLEMQQLMDSGDEEAYIERMAREKLRYARPQERVFIDLTGE